MKLFVTRHGQTQQNEKNLICGITNVELNVTGIRQANELACILDQFPIDIIYSSPLKRAQKTAEIISQKVNAPIFLDPRLLEQDYGLFEGQKRTATGFIEVKKNAAYTEAKNESLFQVAQRVYNFLDELKMCCRQKNILIVSHGGICRIINSYFNSMTTEDLLNFNLPNCSLMIYDL